MKEYILNVEELKKYTEIIKVGDRVLLSGDIYTARDAAHKRLINMLDNNISLPFPLEGAVIYYAGPTPAPEGLPVGSCGPTTSCRMDPYTPRLLGLGLVCMIGKGERSKEVCEAIKINKSIYLCATGGAGALAAKCIKSCEVIAFEDLGCESIKKLHIDNFPLITAIDCNGGNLFK